MAISKFLGSNGVTAVVVGLAVWWFTGNEPSWVQGDGNVDVSVAKATSVRAYCERDAVAQQLERDGVNTDLEMDGHCTVTVCSGDPPAACPRDTVLAETGEPAEVPVDELIEEEKIREEVRAEEKEKAIDELNAEEAAAEEAAAAEGVGSD